MLGAADGVNSLKVPAIRSVLEYLKYVVRPFAFLLVYDVGNNSFLILFLLFVIAVELNEMDRINAWEVMFMVYSLGFSLEKVAAMQEHGIRGDVFRKLTEHHLMKVSSVFFTGTWVRGDFKNRRESPDDRLERV